MSNARELRAGALSALLESDGGLRYIRWGGVEILRRVYAAARDPQWGTHLPAAESVEVRTEAASFSVRFRGRTRAGDIDVSWETAIRGEASGALSWRVEGKAERPFRTNRTGMCVLHPAALAGRPCVVVRDDGTTVSGSFPEAIAPHQPFRRIRAIRWEPAAGVSAEARVEGDVFEMEDQRNWTDDSYKIYSTPLEEPIPRVLPEGATVRHELTLLLNGVPPAGDLSEEVRVEVDRAPAGRLPAVGLPAGVPRSARIRPAHLRVELGPADAPLFREAVREARACGAALEIAVSPAEDVEFDRIAALVRESGLEGARVLVGASWEELLGTARGRLRGLKLGAGSTSFYAALNRRPPRADLVDEVFFPAHPQVHAEDARTILENVEGLRAAVADARRKFPGREVSVTPLAFAPRRRTDPREAGPLGASWAIGSLQALREGGAAGVTVESRAPHVLDALAEAGAFEPAEALPARSSAPERVGAWAVRGYGGARLLLFNRTGDPVTVLAAASGRKVRLEPWGWARVDLE
jgi:hypothetical protein